ncbi:MAG: DUF2946 family protein [Betaproteobacteria bacterium]|nr:DUF2946 family protein [Betaproteobacteria bacterium]
MDEQVLQAMRRWPDVPACAGWLGLDARGQWWIRDAQALPWPRREGGALDKQGASRLLHEGLCAFVARNYQPDEQGCWYFQNGPQRVYVELEAAPLILRLHTGAGAARWSTHTGADCEVREAWLDAPGRVWLGTTAGPALLHSLDMVLLEPWLDDSLCSLRLPGRAPLDLRPLAQTEVESRLGFCASPSAQARWR